MTIETYNEAVRLQMAIRRHQDFVEMFKRQLEQDGNDKTKARKTKESLKEQQQIVKDLQKQFEQL